MTSKLRSATVSAMPWRSISRTIASAIFINRAVSAVCSTMGLLSLKPEECELISKLATNTTKKALFAKLAAHHRTLAEEVERALKMSGGTLRAPEN
ncbi:hypothetical protein [Bradyrhizobium jicamae]|uniref:hypothetical protein n=1 Tax=Bradyrhizobium jicamae TaxID=280332 RepID=UPI001BA69B2D|nr:hypothetical protein [Bradyrhizobium jicamae]MBR0939337.1 hypothetical protein [Bradyrhizobium jicamae]